MIPLSKINKPISVVYIKKQAKRLIKFRKSSFWKQLRPQLIEINTLDGFSLLWSTVEQQIRSLWLSKLELLHIFNLSLSHIPIIEAVPNGRVFLQVPCITNIMSSFGLVSNVNDESIKFVIVIWDIFIGQNFAKINIELKIEWLLYLFTSSRVLKQSNADN